MRWYIKCYPLDEVYDKTITEDRWMLIGYEMNMAGYMDAVAIREKRRKQGTAMVSMDFGPDAIEPEEEEVVVRVAVHRAKDYDTTWDLLEEYKPDAAWKRYEKYKENMKTIKKAIEEASTNQCGS